MTNITRFLLFFLTSITSSLFYFPNAVASPSNAIVLISIDGFRYDYLDKYHAPNLQQLARQGVRAQSMRPSYPSVTFPNHITLVTGQYPAHHGLVHNEFYDKKLDDVYSMGKAAKQPAWMQALPIWTLAEQKGLVTATFFWPESDAELSGVQPHYFYHYNKSTPYQQRIDQIITWLKMPTDKRPVFIASYFSKVDTAGHHYGPDSPQVAAAVSMVDGYIGNLKQRIDQLNSPVNLIVVSDHGMQAIQATSQINWQAMPGIKNYRVIDRHTQLLLYNKSNLTQQQLRHDGQQLRNMSKGRYSVYFKGEFPDYLHYNDNARIADIVLDANPPAYFPSWDLRKKIITKQQPDKNNGSHGFDPVKTPNMQALFIANGPNFKSGVTIDTFDNIHVFPAMMAILDLPLPARTDGELAVLKPILKNLPSSNN